MTETARFLVDLVYRMYERFGEGYPILSTLLAFIVTGILGVVTWHVVIGGAFRNSLPKPFLVCAEIVAPIPFPANSTILSLDPRRSVQGLTEDISSALEGHALWPSRASSGEGMYRCELQNRSERDASSLSLSFDIQLMAAVPSRPPGATVSGPVISSYMHRVDIPELRGTRTASPLVFYVRNTLPQYLAIRLPGHATLRGQTGRRIEIPLGHSSAEDWLTLPPVSSP